MAKVSIIIPNYNHANFLKKRLETVCNQTYKDFELIFLDDASTDNSMEIFYKCPQELRVQVHCNQVNSGNPFKQWNKGGCLARGEYIWIAESDDYAEENLLAALVDVLDNNPRVGLAYCLSVVVDDEDNVIDTNQSYYQGFADSWRWNQDYQNSGLAEIQTYMAQLCTIPNASAVLLRREAFSQVGGADESFRLAGDWITWLKILQHWDIAYLAQPLNYFRRHASTVRAMADRTGLFVEEYYRVQALLHQWLPIPAAIRQRSLSFISYHWFRAGVTGQLAEAASSRLYHLARPIDPHLPLRLLKYLIKYPVRIIINREKPYLPFLGNIAALVAADAVGVLGRRKTTQ